MHQYEGSARERPAFLARLVGQHQVEARRLAPVRVGGSGTKGLVVGADEHTVLVLQQGVSHLVLQRVGIFDIADRPRQALHVGGHTFVALAGNAGSPFHRGVVADLVFPLGADLRQVVGENEGRAGTVGPRNHRDVLIGQLNAFVQRGDRGRIPLGDLAKINIGDHRAGEAYTARLDALNIHHRHDTAHDHRELHEAFFFQLLGSERRIGRAEIDRLGGNLLDAATRPDRLIVHADAGLGLVGFGPLRVERIGKGRAGASDVGGDCGVRRGEPQRHRGARDKSLDGCGFHGLSPVGMHDGNLQDGRMINADCYSFVTRGACSRWRPDGDTRLISCGMQGMPGRGD